MKKKLLFIIDSLRVGGAEKSLVTLLNLIDYSKYEVDLQLFAYGGMFEQFVPKDVNILPVIKIKSFAARIAYSLLLRLKKRNHASIARVYWQTIGRSLPVNPKQYDAAIGYGQCIPTFYVIDKTNANCKYVWVNCVFHLVGKELNFQRQFYYKAKTISVVSPEAMEHFQSVYPEFKHKMQVVQDLYDGKFIQQMSKMNAEKEIDHSIPVIMTTGRLNKPQKAYDLALASAKILHERGLKFHWYAIGEGPYRTEMEKYIENNKLQNVFILLGSTPNPYAYMRQCDIYVQTSRFEGFGLTIAEARMLNRPIVCTNFEACHMQLKDGENALITSFCPSDIANAIEKLLTNKELYHSILSNLELEKKGNSEEIEKFYKLIES
ncbi:MAG: glycosyltransferase [Bacteroidaceae bacterium]|nr:glycosyltransferase [Bacteroidaceae bacterium]